MGIALQTLQFEQDSHYSTMEFEHIDPPPLPPSHKNSVNMIFIKHQKCIMIINGCQSTSKSDIWRQKCRITAMNVQK